MNLWMSLLLYNPLEAFVLLWACHSFNPATKDEKFDFVKNVKHFYILGAILLGIEYIPFVLPDGFSTLFLTIITTLLFIPASMYLYNAYIRKTRYRFKLCFTVLLVYFLSQLILINLFGLDMFSNKDFYFELLYNMAIKTIQIIIFYIFRRFYAKRKTYENCEK